MPIRFLLFFLSRVVSCFDFVSTFPHFVSHFHIKCITLALFPSTFFARTWSVTRCFATRKTTEQKRTCNHRLWQVRFKRLVRCSGATFGVDVEWRLEFADGAGRLLVTKNLAPLARHRFCLPSHRCKHLVAHVSKAKTFPMTNSKRKRRSSEGNKQEVQTAGGKVIAHGSEKLWTF